VSNPDLSITQERSERLWLCPDVSCDHVVFGFEQPPPCRDHPFQQMREVKP
jgi:hypothetical protein